MGVRSFIDKKFCWSAAEAQRWMVVGGEWEVGHRASPAPACALWGFTHFSYVALRCTRAARDLKLELRRRQTYVGNKCNIGPLQQRIFNKGGLTRDISW